MKSLENLLNRAEKDELGGVVKRAHQMGKLVHLLQQALPAPTGAQIVAANVREDGQLVVLAASPAWAAKLRFEADKLLAVAREAGIEATQCKVRVSQDS